MAKPGHSLASCLRRGQVRTASGRSGQRPGLKFRIAVRLPFSKGKEDPERSGLEEFSDFAFKIIKGVWGPPHIY